MYLTVYHNRLLLLQLQHSAVPFLSLLTRLRPRGQPPQTLYYRTFRSMAVLDAHPGLSTVVTVNKQPLTEYDNDEETDPGVANKYVEASSGAEFVIETVIKSPFPTVNGVEISVTVDGSRGPRFGYGPDELLYRSIQVKGVSITQGGERHRQNYQISELNVGKNIS